VGAHPRERVSCGAAVPTAHNVRCVKQRLEWANSLRGVAAASVVVFHFGVAFWVLQPQAADIARRPALYAGDEGAPRTAELLRAIPVELGAFGVGLFFLLSGFVIAISLDKYSRRGFLVARFMRLLPTYFVAYLVTCSVIAVLGNPKDELHLGSVLAGSVPGLHYLLGVHAPPNGIVWTLIIELAFYGICLVGYRTLTRRWEVIALAGLGCVLVQWLVAAPDVITGSSIGGLRYVVLLSAPFLPVLLIGVTLSARSRGHIGRAATAALVVGLAGVHLGLMMTTDVVPTSRLYKLTFLGVIALFCVVWAVGERVRRHPVSDLVADISYPLYVVHPVLGYAMLSVLASRGIPAPVGVPVTMAVAVLAAWALHRLVEKPTHRLGQQWARRLDGRSTAASPPALPVPSRSVDEPATSRAA
jgi:peptidoglycan/LPS O-acetylase OafA/YrhL